MNTLVIGLGSLLAVWLLPAGGYWLGQRLRSEVRDALLAVLGTLMFVPTVMHLAAEVDALQVYGDPNILHRYTGPLWTHPAFWIAMVLVMFGLALSRKPKVKYVTVERDDGGW